MVFLVKIFISFKILVFIFLLLVKNDMICCFLFLAILTAMLITLGIFLTDKWRALIAQGKDPSVDWSVRPNIMYIALIMLLLLVAVFIIKPMHSC